MAVRLSRAVVMYLSPLAMGSRWKAVPLSWQHVLNWGGLRGAVGLALALSLPVSLADRDELRVMTFGVVLFTLVVQATTMPLLLRRLGLVKVSPHYVERDLRVGRLYAIEASWRRLNELHN